MHIDDWLDKPSWDEKENYARFVLDYKRFPAWKQTAYEPYLRQYKLFCKYKGNIYRVTGASRLGDVYLSSDFTQQHGYTERVNVTECSEWSDSVESIENDNKR